MTPAEAQALADSLEWRFAKTMPQIPHFYVVRGEHLPGEVFDDFVRHIRFYGRPGIWRKTKRVTYMEDGSEVEGLHYLAMGEHLYWTMGEPIGECQIINREDLWRDEVVYLD